MLDFLMIATRTVKRGVIEIYPKFKINKSNDLMIRGGDFYAIWIDEEGRWSTDEQDALRLIDNEIDIFAKEHEEKLQADIVHIKHMWDADSGCIDKWHKYCQKQMRDNYHQLDEKLIFSNQKAKKRDYASKSLTYPLEKGKIPAYDELMSTLYSKEERRKLEWAIGAVVSGESKKIQKFVVLYGAAGTGKSTVLNIIQQLFDGYYSVFDSKALGSSNNSFALEAFRSNPLVAIQHDGDLSRIEDNTRLNSLVSHELMTVNEKFKATYTSKFNSFIFMGTNKPVKITDAKSGLIRRLIDVSPSGNKVHHMRYNKLVKQIEFELGGIAYHCMEVYQKKPDRYDNYIPTSMMGESNDFYNFMIDNYFDFANEDQITLKSAWERYKLYCEDANLYRTLSLTHFKSEFRNYFREFDEKQKMVDGIRVRNVYSGFRTEKFDNKQETPEEPEIELINFRKIKSIFDKEAADWPAQYGNEDEKPTKKWADVKTKLSDLDTSKLHYVRVPQNHIVIDFDIPDDEGNKSYEKNLEEASKFPPTYAELSKSGAGIHLHYIYDGDPSLLETKYDDHIEIKVFKGKASLRRCLTKCNDIPIATISSGLPVKGDKKVVNFENIKDDLELRRRIEKVLRKEYDNIPGTASGIGLIKKILDEAYENDISYDVTDLRGRIVAFAGNSTHQAEKCVKEVSKMKLMGKQEELESKKQEEGTIIFYDVEVFPNLFLVCWKAQGTENIVHMFNPKPEAIEDLISYRLIGFNNRRYDNHMLYACMMGYSPEQIYKLSQRIISGDKNAFFARAYNLSYTDIYDFSSKKQSLKKFEIELGIHHQELGLPWDESVPEELWKKVAEYCDNDVIATEEVFNSKKRQADFTGRKILAAMAGGTVNDTTNSLTTKFIFGNNHKPQSQFNYRHMNELHDDDFFDITWGKNDYVRFNADKKPVFPGYTFRAGKSHYRGEEVGEGGYVYSEPGMYGNVALLDIASMHPTSIVKENLFGDEYTARFNDILNARIAIKHGDFEKARKMMNGLFAGYLTDEKAAEDLAYALKIAINSVYGLTSAKFENAFRDIRNKDNIVAKRGALFMINLKHAVQEQGYTVAHIKTDSIKIPDADRKIIKFVQDFGKLYGYTFEHEATYDRMCLVNDAVYIAKYKDPENHKHNGWTATGTQFAVPYVFKTLFSREQIEFKDMCETKSVTSALYLDMKDSDNPEDYQFIGKVGSFCPMAKGGGRLLRGKDGKYAAATGTKGYKWLEAEIVEKLDKKDNIDISYYQKLVNDAIEEISKYGSFDWFVSDESYEKGMFKLTGDVISNE